MSTERDHHRRVHGIAAASAALVFAFASISLAAASPPDDESPVVEEPTGEPMSYASEVHSDRVSVSPAAAEQRVRLGLGTGTVVTDVISSSSSKGRKITVMLDRMDDPIKATWEANLAAGAYAELIHGAEPAYSDLVDSAQATGPGVDGSDNTIPLGIGAARFGQIFGSPSDADLAEHAGEVAKRFGLDIVDLEILHPLDSAMHVSLTVPDKDKIRWTIKDLTDSLFGPSPNVEGHLIELLSEDGKPLLRTSAAFRVGSGSLWFAPGEDSRFGATHGSSPWD